MEELKTEVRELRNVSKHNKPNVKNTRVTLTVDDMDYDLVIRGIGNKAIKLEMYIKYEDIILHKDSPLEKKLWDKLTDVYEDTKSTTIGERRVFI